MLPSCDKDNKLLGYNNDAETIAIEEKITNVFTNEPFIRATVDISGQDATANPEGGYKLLYLLGNDENLNRPIPVMITAEKYRPLYTDLVISPENMSFDVALENG